MNEDKSKELATEKEFIANLFGRAAPTYDQVGPGFFSHFGRRLVELAQVPAGSRVLDVATGRGAVLFPAAKAAGPDGKIIGIDLSNTMISETKAEIAQRGLDNIEVLRMDAEELEFADGSFDCVFCGLSFFFFPRPDRTLAEMRRVLKLGGRIGLTTFWHDDERWDWLGELFQDYLPPQQPTEDQEPEEESGPDFRSHEGMQTFLAEAGFGEISVLGEEPDFIYTSEEDWWKTVWSHGMRSALERIERFSGPDALQAFKRDAFKKMQLVKGPTGFHHMWSVLFTVAIKKALS